MPKPLPLQSQDPNPKDTRFSTFGVLDTGKRSTGAAITATITNVSIVALLLWLGYIIKPAPPKVVHVSTLVLPSEAPKEPPPPPKPPPPPPPKLPPPPKPIEPKVPPPDPIKPPDIKPIEVPTPKPVALAPAPPKKVEPPPAPKVIPNLAAAPASVPNHDAHPSAVRLGAQDNPLKPTTGPSVSPVNFGVAGAPGMQKSNTGNGAPSQIASLGSGSPTSSNMAGHDNKPYTVAGLANGTLGSTGSTKSTNITNVTVGTPQIKQVAVITPPAKSPKPPTVTYKPDPMYTAEAKALNLQGNVSLRIRVAANGSVTVLGVVQGLGHGLDQSAIQAAQATKFRPAVDATGVPIDWEGVVLVKFQLG